MSAVHKGAGHEGNAPYYQAEIEFRRTLGSSEPIRMKAMRHGAVPRLTQGTHRIRIGPARPRRPAQADTGQTTGHHCRDVQKSGQAPTRSIYGAGHRAHAAGYVGAVWRIPEIGFCVLEKAGDGYGGEGELNLDGGLKSAATAPAWKTTERKGI